MDGKPSGEQAHRLRLELCDAQPPEIDAGTAFGFRVRAWCPSGCNLAGSRVVVSGPDGSAASAELLEQEGGAFEAEFGGVEAPRSVGEHAWNVSLVADDNPLHTEACLPLVVTTRPHATSLAIWDLPSPVVMDRPFRVKVGLKCSASCGLAGAMVEVVDNDGRVAGTGSVGASAWPGTEHLHWADLELASPSAEDVFSWSVRFAANEGALPHAAASRSFSFRTARPPDGRVTVVLVADGDQMPLADAEVNAGPYRAHTDESGVAVIDLPQGTYEFTIRTDGFAAEPVSTTVGPDSRVEIRALKTLTKAEWEEKLMRFDDYSWG